MALDTGNRKTERSRLGRKVAACRLTDHPGNGHPLGENSELGNGTGEAHKMTTASRVRCIFGFALALVPLLAPSLVVAQSYPSHRITLIVPYTPGSGFDIVARTIGQKLSERWGQAVVVDIKPGASGTLGTEMV